MKKPTKSLVVPTIITCTFAWVWFTSHAIEECKRGSTNESLDAANLIERIKENTITSKVDSFYKEFERLKEDERKRLEELERQRLERLEKIKLAKIEEAKKIAEQKRIEKERLLAEVKRIEEAKKAEQVNNTSGWMTFNATYYSAFCNTCGGKGLTASGVSVADSIYYNGYRIIATNQNEIPMWAIVEVKASYGTFKAIALDTGGFGANGVDILVDSDETAYRMGRHDVKIKIIGSMK